MSLGYFLLLEGTLLALAAFLFRRVWNSKIEIPGVKELVAERDDLLTACELFEKWMLGGQPQPYSDSQILDIVRRAIAKARSPGQRSNGAPGGNG